MQGVPRTGNGRSSPLHTGDLRLALLAEILSSRRKAGRPPLLVQIDWIVVGTFLLALIVLLETGHAILGAFSS